MKIITMLIMCITKQKEDYQLLESKTCFSIIWNLCPPKTDLFIAVSCRDASNGLVWVQTNQIDINQFDQIVFYNQYTILDCL